jgi:predicted transcriptional regulator
MKTAISIPDEVFREADRLARRMGKSRSQLYGEAVKEYLFRRAPDGVTEAMNQVMDGLGPQADPFLARAARRVLARNEW